MQLHRKSSIVPLTTVLSVLLWLVISTLPATAQTLSVLYSFTGGADGNGPIAKLTRDSAGNLYGTTQFGGNLNFGVVFKLDTNGVETVLHSFTGGLDGFYPYAGVVLDPAGNLYGTTSGGGTHAGDGVIFKIDTSNNETVLHNFTGSSDGASPLGDLLRDSAGNLYGTACCGGSSNFGVVFRLDPTNKELALGFPSDSGDYPAAGLVRDSAGNFYGTTNFGGRGFGTVYEVTNRGKMTVLYAFLGKADGSNPRSTLVIDAAGNLYGTTVGGGTSGNGTVFKLDKTGKETVIWSFTGGADGGAPWAGMLPDSAGNLYGTVSIGGAFNAGGVFKIASNGTESVIYSFTGGNDGSCPMAALIADSAGNFYGTTQSGGTAGWGVVFKLTP